VCCKGALPGPVCQGTAATSENNFHTTGGDEQDFDRETCADTLS